MSTTDTDETDETTDSNDNKLRNIREPAAEWGQEQAEKKERERKRKSAPIDFESETRNGHSVRGGTHISIIQFHKKLVEKGRDEMVSALESADTVSEQERLKTKFARELAEQNGTQFGPKDDNIRRA